MRINILIFFISLTHSLFSQNLGCGTLNPTLTQQKALDKLMQGQGQQGIRRAMSEPQEFPIIAHIIRRDDGTEGLSEQQLRDALDRVNTYFSNANLSFFYLDIRYIDDSGHSDFIRSNEEALISQYSFPGIINIYFANSINSGRVCGYTRLPTPSNPENSNIILMANECTTNGTTLTHELGHFFGLYHTHGNLRFTDELVIRPGEVSVGCVAPDCIPSPANCATNGDRLCDTEADFNLGFAGQVSDSCEYTGGITDSNNDLFRPNTKNIMSYSRKSCRNIFTTGQNERMNMTSTTSRDYLHKSRIFANFKGDKQLDCNEFSINYDPSLSINEETYSWYFEGGNPATSTDSNPTVRYLNGGTYDVRLTVSDTMGNEHTTTYTDYITVIDRITPNIHSIAGSFEENPLSEIIIDDGQGITWEQTALAASDGNKSMKRTLYKSRRDEEDLLILKPFNATVDTSFVLTFDYAFATLNSNRDRLNSLEIFIRDLCSRVPYLLATIVGSRLTTAPNNSISDFVPTDNQWATDTIIFSRIEGSEAGEIFFKTTAYNGNTIYIDNYRIVPIKAPIRTEVDFPIIPTIMVGFQLDPPVDFVPFFSDSNGDALTYTVTSSNENIAAVAIVETSKLSLTAVGAGTATITVTATNSTNFSVSDSLIVTVEAVALGIAETEILAIYPNPSSGIFHLSHTADMVRVYDMSGRLVYRGRDVAQLNLTNNPTGQYLVEVHIGKERGRYTVIRE